MSTLWYIAGCCGSVVIVTAVALAYALPAFCRASDRMSTWQRRALVFLMCLGAAYAIAKSTGTISYPRTNPDVSYIIDNGSYVTNDAVHVAFTRTPLVPASANFYLDALELCYTNQEDWATHSFTAYSNKFENMSVPFDFEFANATNYNWVGYTDWVPGPTVHTNGVAFVTWQKADVIDSAANIVMTRTGLYINQEHVSPSASITNGPPLSFFLSIDLSSELNDQEGAPNEDR